MFRCTLQASPYLSAAFFSSSYPEPTISMHFLLASVTEMQATSVSIAFRTFSNSIPLVNRFFRRLNWGVGNFLLHRNRFKLHFFTGRIWARTNHSKLQGDCFMLQSLVPIVIKQNFFILLAVSVKYKAARCSIQPPKVVRTCRKTILSKSFQLRLSIDYSAVLYVRRIRIVNVFFRENAISIRLYAFKIFARVRIWSWANQRAIQKNFEDLEIKDMWVRSILLKGKLSSKTKSAYPSTRCTMNRLMLHTKKFVFGFLEFSKDFQRNMWGMFPHFVHTSSSKKGNAVPRRKIC